MTTSTKSTTLTDQLLNKVIKHLGEYYFDPDTDDPEDCATELVDIMRMELTQQLKLKIKTCDESMKSPTVTMEECGWNCLDSKKKAFNEVISMLKVRK